jgi:hypothetical protein
MAHSRSMGARGGILSEWEARRLIASRRQPGRLRGLRRQRGHVASRFYVGTVQALPFKPGLKMKLTGKGQTDGKHPALVTT